MKELNHMNNKSLSEYKTLIDSNLQSLNLKNYDADDSNSILYHCNYPNKQELIKLEKITVSDLKSQKILFMDSKSTFWVWVG